MSQKYQIDMKCPNCKKLNWIGDIPQGTLVNDFLEEEELRCRVCNCLLYHKKEEDKDEKEDKDK